MEKIEPVKKMKMKKRELAPKFNDGIEVRLNLTKIETPHFKK